MKRSMLLAAGVLVAATLATPVTRASAAGNVSCSDTQLNGGPYGNVTVPSGSWCDISSATVQGNVFASGATGLGITGSTIQGSVDAQNTKGSNDPSGYGDNYICNSTIGGTVEILYTKASSTTVTTGDWNIGDSSAEPYCSSSKNVDIGGNLQFEYNKGTVGESCVGICFCPPFCG